MSSELHLVLQCRMQMAAPFEPARRDVPAGQCPIRLTSAVEKLTVVRYCKAAKLASVRAGRRLSPTSLLSSDNACQSDTGSKYGRPFRFSRLLVPCLSRLHLMYNPTRDRTPPYALQIRHHKHRYPSIHSRPSPTCTGGITSYTEQSS